MVPGPQARTKQWGSVLFSNESIFTQLRKPAPSNLSQLEVYIKQAWESIPPDDIKKLIDPMADRIQASIDANGGITEY